MSFVGGIRRHISLTATPNATAIVKKIAFEAFSRVIMKTPVDTGRARGNWQAEINSLPSGQLDDIDKGQKGSSSSDGSGRSSSKNKVLGVVSKIELGDSVILANNLDYIQSLEDGSSKQARDPNGMVKVTLLELDNVLKAASK